MTLQAQIAALRVRSTAELAAEYERLHGRRPRYRSRPWLMKRIGFKLQEHAFGGLPAAARAALERLAADVQLPAAEAPTNRTGPSKTLVREWRGMRIVVEVNDKGFVWNNQTFTSLSAVAYAVTGARWNGRLFFGLTERKG